MKAVQLSADARGEPIDVDAFHAGIVAHCADALAMFARHRAALPLGTVAETEARIRRQCGAILSLEGDGLGHAAAWWEQSVDSADPWKAWAAIFSLGSIGASGSQEAIRLALERIADDDDERWAPAAEALALVELPDAVALGHALLSSDHAVTQAVGIDLLSRWEALPVDLLKRQFESTEPSVLASASRAAGRTGAAKALTAELLACLRSNGGAVAWEAARVLTLVGVREPYLEIQAGGSLASALGARGVELLVMAGEELDIGALEALLAGTPMTAPLLSAVARFGNVTAWSFLLHYLADPELAEAAVSGVRTLFGALVPDVEATNFSAWKTAIVEAGFHPDLRYRRGELWRPATVLAECASGQLPRAEVEARLDELAARTGAQGHVDLGLWELDVRRALAAFAEDVGARDGRWRPGAWR
jgi:hypothetical protein